MAETIANYNVIVDVESRLDGLEGGIDSVNKKVSGLGSGIKKAVGAFAAVFAVRELGRLGGAAVKAAANYETLTNSFKIFTGSAEAAAKLLGDLEKFSLATPFEPTQVTNAAKTLLGFGRATDVVLEDIELLGNVAAATGTDIEQLGLVFGQVAGIGKLQGQDALQFINAGIPLYQLLSESMGVAVSEVKELQSQGKITFDVLRQAFADASKEGGKFAGALLTQSKSINGLFSTLSGAGQTILRSLGESLLPILKEILPPLIRGAFAMADAFKAFAAEAKTLIGPFVQLMRQAISPIQEAFGRLSANLNKAREGSSFLQRALTFLARSFTVTSKIITPLIDAVAALFGYLGDTGIVSGFINAFTSWPAVLNGVIEAVKALGANTTLFFQRNIKELQLLIERGKALVGAGNKDLINQLERDIENLGPGETLAEAYQRGFDEIQNIEVKPPKIDTEENLGTVGAQGEKVGEAIGKGVEKGAKKEIEEFGFIDALNTELDKLRKKLELQLALQNFIGAARTGEEIEELAGQLANLESLIDNFVDTPEKRDAISEVLGIQDGLDAQQSRNVEKMLGDVGDKMERNARSTEKKPFLHRLLGVDEEGLNAFKAKLAETLNVVKGFLQDQFALEREQVDRQISLQQERVNKAQEIADKGNAKALEKEEARLEQLMEKREAIAERERRLASLQIVAANAVAAAESIKAIAKGFGGNIALGIATGVALAAQIAAVVSSVNGAFSDLPGFAHGIESVPGFGNSKSDSITARLSVGERVTDAATNAKLGGIPNSMLPLAVATFRQLPYLRQDIMNSVGDTINKQLTQKMEALGNKVDALIHVNKSKNFAFKISKHGIAAINAEGVREQNNRKDLIG